MIELQAVTYAGAPGVTLLWIVAGVIYGALLMAAIHWRILYSAT